jgi:hypothetical protein
MDKKQNLLSKKKKLYIQLHSWRSLLHAAPPSLRSVPTRPQAPPIHLVPGHLIVVLVAAIDEKGTEGAMLHEGRREEEAGLD